MDEVQDEYVAQVLKGMNEIGDKLFPPGMMAEFDRTAQAEIAADKNRCAFHQDRITLERVWPDGAWICHECAQNMWKTGGWPAGMMVVNMADRPADWKP